MWAVVGYKEVGEGGENGRGEGSRKYIVCQIFAEVIM